MDVGRCCRACALCLLSLGVIASRVGYYIVTPLWMDFFKPLDFPLGNLTNASVWPSNRTLSVFPFASDGINATFMVVGQFLFVTMCTGSALIFMRMLCPGTLTEATYRYPKRRIFIIALGMSLSAVGFNYALSGSRVAPYLTAILGNFNIPIQFAVR